MGLDLDMGLGFHAHFGLGVGMKPKPTIFGCECMIPTTLFKKKKHYQKCIEGSKIFRKIGDKVVVLFPGEISVNLRYNTALISS